MQGQKMNQQDCEISIKITKILLLGATGSYNYV